VGARAREEEAAFNAYSAALDSEERAAKRYARLMPRADHSGEAGLALQLAQLETEPGLS
jgi:hypothetical protein